MNYIKEINAFYDLMELEPLSASAVNLWHSLLHINNKARWSIEFTVSSTVLKLKGGLPESSFQRARKELVNRGLVECRSRGRNLAPAYRMKRLYHMLDEFDRSMESDESDVGLKGQTAGQVNVQADQQAVEEMEGQTREEAGALIKQNEIKQKETKQEVDALVFYQENFGVVSSFVMEDIVFWMDDVGEGLVVEALKRALERNKANWGYVKSILRSWVRKGIRTVETARAERLDVGRERVTLGKRSSGEVVPEWFLEQKRKRNLQEVVESDTEGTGDVSEMLERYLGEG